jgi:hypothetical protein
VCDVVRKGRVCGTGDIGEEIRTGAIRANCHDKPEDRSTAKGLDRKRRKHVNFIHSIENIYRYKFLIKS